MRAITIFLFLFANAFISKAQSEYLAEIHPESNYFSLLTPPVIEDVNWVYVGMSAVDEQSGTFYFLRSSVPDSLCGYNLSTMEISAHVPCYADFGLSSMRSMHFNPNSGTLDGIHFSQSEQKYFIGSVDITTGSTMQLGDFFPSSFLHFVNADAFDASNNEIIVYDHDFGNPKLMRYSLGDGSLVSEIELDIPVNMGVNGIVWNSDNQTLYTILISWLSETSYAATIDEENGNVNVIGDGFTTIHYPYETYSIDQDELTLYMQGGANEMSYGFSGVSLNSGELVSSAQLLPAGGTFEDIENLVNGRYMNSLDKLVCLHWGDDVVDIAEGEAESTQPLVSINQTDGHLAIYSMSELIKPQFNLMDLSGRVCFNEQCDYLDAGNTHTVTNSFSPGIYFLRVTSTGNDDIVFKVLIE